MEHSHKDFAYHYIDKVNELYAQLKMPVYGIYKVRNPKTLRALEKIIRLLEKSTAEELLLFRKTLQRQKAGKRH